MSLPFTTRLRAAPGRLTAALVLALIWIQLGTLSGSGAVSSSREAAAPAALRLLKAECFACHNQEKKKGGLVLTSRERLLEGGDNGPAVVPGQPDASLLARVLARDADPHMPPKKQLADAQIRAVREWIRLGLAWDDAVLNEEDPILPVRLASLPATYQPGLALALSPDGRRLAFGRGGAVWLHDATVTNFPLQAMVQAHPDAVEALAWSADGRRLASGGFRRVALWDGDTLAREREWTNALAGRVTGLRFTPDGRTLVLADSVAGRGGFVRVLDLEQGRILHSWRAHDDTVFGFDLSRDGRQLVTAGGDRLIKVWELAARNEVARLEGHTAAVLAVAFNSNATQVASGGADKQLKVWDIATRHLASNLGKHAAAVSAVDWPGDGQVLAAGTDAGTVLTYRNLKTHSGRESSEAGEERKLGEATDAVTRLACTPDAKRVVAGLQDGSVQVWNSEGKLLARLSGPTNGPAPVFAAPGKSGRKEPRPTAVPAPTVSFLHDVLPVLSKAGCNAGACHAKPEGQNGFRLTVFSYDPKSDYAEIVKEHRGRRVFPAAPDQSLFLLKPLGALPHEGGVRFERGSDTHRLLERWLREGMTYRLTNEPVLQRITVSPKERRYRKGGTQRLQVTAHYSDGSTRDVTRLAGFDSNDKEIAKVDEDGRVTIGRLAGQGVVVARYMGFVDDAQILVPADKLLPASRYAALPRNNFIDDLAWAHFQRLGLFPSDLCTDAEFLRRASLDSIGVLPTPEEVREFLGLEAAGGAKEADAADAASRQQERRRAVIDRLLARPEYADYWATQWADLLRPNPDRVGVKSVFVFDQWLRENFRRNRPYDQFVRDILLAEGTNHRDGPAVVYRDRREPPELTTLFSQIFLGTRLECAKCHHHPNEKWGQEDFYQFAAFFGPVKQKGAGLSPPISAGTETFFFAAGGKAVKHPVTGETMTPRPPDGPVLNAADTADPRRALADWLTAPDNPFFARAVVNRVWAGFFGRGLVEPVDDFRISNPCVNPALLQALADDFARHGFDLKHLMRTIMESRLYQLSGTPNEWNLADTRNFSRAYRRRLPAEVLLDAVTAVTGVPDTFTGLPPGARATQAWTYKIESRLLDAFSRPNPSSDPPCDRDRQLSVVQSLHLMNSRALQSKLSAKTGRVRQLADSPRSPAEIVTEIYLLALSRPPTAEELKLATATFTTEKATRAGATEDVLWALLNSAEFVLNH